MPVDYDLSQLRLARQMRRRTLKEAAAAVGISHSYLSQAERGQRQLPLDTLTALASYYDYALGSLVGEVHTRPEGIRATVVRPGPQPVVDMEPGRLRARMLYDDDLVMQMRVTAQPGLYGPYIFEQRVICVVMVGAGTLLVHGEGRHAFVEGDVLSFDARGGYSFDVTVAAQLLLTNIYDGPMDSRL